MAAGMVKSTAILAAMQRGGFYDRVLAGGAELDRVKAYLRSLASPVPAARADPLQYPTYPLFPGLRHQPWHDASGYAAAAQLEAASTLIRDEYAALADADLVHYEPPAMDRLWAVYMLWHMGVEVDAAPSRCPRTCALLRALPRVCLAYPWGDALFSVHAADSHLRAHCSVDNLRLRLHLALEVPDGCAIRVGTQTRRWQPGRVLAFEDSFEHEVWNRGRERRAILIVDLWHPDLTALEIEVLSAGFCQSQVRQLFLQQRVAMLSGDHPQLLRRLADGMAAQDEDAAVSRWWGR